MKPWQSLSCVAFCVAGPAARVQAQCLGWSEGFGLPGTDGETLAAAFFDAGPGTQELLVGGQFGLAGDQSASCIARLTGGRWMESRRPGQNRASRPSGADSSQAASRARAGDAADELPIASQPHPDGSSLTPSPEEVRAQLERILESPHFAPADRARKFLRYLVGQTLDGKAQRLKEYTIAIEVFDRGASFDPGTNPSVRVEASRLRRRLELYYLTLGREDPVLIEVPRGAYVPAFRAQADVLHLREEVSALPSSTATG